MEEEKKPLLGEKPEEVKIEEIEIDEEIKKQLDDGDGKGKQLKGAE